MQRLVIGLVLVGWGLLALTLYLAWIVRVDSFKLLIPLFCLPMALMIWMFTTAYSLLQMLRIMQWGEDFAVYLVNAALGAVPMLYYVYLFAVYEGPRSQFVLEYLLHPRL